MATKERQPYGAGTVELSVAPVRDGLCALEIPEEGACARSALRLLRARNLQPQSVVAVSPYAISYINHTGKVRTAWTVREKVPNGGSRLVVAVEDGLPAFPVKPTTIEVA